MIASSFAYNPGSEPEIWLTEKVIEDASRERSFEFVSAPIKKAAPKMMKKTELSNMFQVYLRVAREERSDAERTVAPEYAAFFDKEVQGVLQSSY